MRRLSSTAVACSSGFLSCRANMPVRLGPRHLSSFSEEESEIDSFAARSLGRSARPPMSRLPKLLHSSIPLGMTGRIERDLSKTAHPGNGVCLSRLWRIRHGLRYFHRSAYRFGKTV